jgi:hypothetical protein
MNKSNVTTAASSVKNTAFLFKNESNVVANGDKGKHQAENHQPGYDQNRNPKREVHVESLQSRENIEFASSNLRAVAPKVATTNERSAV